MADNDENVTININDKHSKEVKTLNVNINLLKNITSVLEISTH